MDVVYGYEMDNVMSSDDLYQPLITFLYLVVCGGMERLMSKITENDAPLLIIVCIGSNMPQRATDHKSNKQRKLNGRTFFTGSAATWGKLKVFYPYFVSGTDNEVWGNQGTYRE